MAVGPDQFQLGAATAVTVDRRDHMPLWIESAWVDSDRTIYAWYHHEPTGVCPGDLTAPRIGALVSYDGGRLFYDLGVVLASGDEVNCSSENGFFAGGHGDFSVILDRDQSYFYFLFTNYGGSVSSQGIAIARMAFGDRTAPAGALWKYFDGRWDEPGLSGRVTPAIPARVGWESADTDSFWGPAIHWNTHLESYVVLLNRSCCRPKWPQEGIYVSYNADLSRPDYWKTPQLLLRENAYYPQVMGLSPDETDTEAGQLTRLYVQGKSSWQLVFHKDDIGVERTEGPAAGSDLPLGRRPRK